MSSFSLYILYIYIYYGSQNVFICIQVFVCIYIHSDRPTDRPTDTHTRTQTDRHVGRHVRTHAYTHTYVFILPIQNTNAKYVLH